MEQIFSNEFAKYTLVMAAYIFLLVAGCSWYVYCITEIVVFAVKGVKKLFGKFKSWRNRNKADNN